MGYNKRKSLWAQESCPIDLQREISDEHSRSPYATHQYHHITGLNIWLAQSRSGKASKFTETRYYLNAPSSMSIHFITIISKCCILSTQASLYSIQLLDEIDQTHSGYLLQIVFCLIKRTKNLICIVKYFIVSKYTQPGSIFLKGVYD